MQQKLDERLTNERANLPERHNNVEETEQRKEQANEKNDKALRHGRPATISSDTGVVEEGGEQLLHVSMSDELSGERKSKKKKLGVSITPLFYYDRSLIRVLPVSV